jgi:cytochrome c
MARKYLLIVVLGAALVLSGCAAANFWTESVLSQAASDAPAVDGNAVRGGELFHLGANNAPPCGSCHQTTAGSSGFAIGPNLSGIADRAASRIAGMSAEDYLANSILDPSSYLVPGYRGMMYNQYGGHFDARDIDDLVAYLMTL